MRSEHARPLRDERTLSVSLDGESNMNITMQQGEGTSDGEAEKEMRAVRLTGAESKKEQDRGPLPWDRQ